MPAAALTLVAAHHWFDDVIGGSFRLATEFAEHLASCGHEVAYVCCGKPDQTAPVHRTRERGVSIWRYAPPTSGGRIRRMRFHIGRTGDLAREVTRGSTVGIVHGHSPLQHYGVQRAARSTTTRFHYTVHSPFDDELLSNLPMGTSTIKTMGIATVARWIERRNLANATFVQTDSEFTLSELRRKYPTVMTGRGTVAPGWVDGERFHSTANRREVRRSLDGVWDTELPVFLTVRRLEARMGIDTLIDAASILHRRGLRFRVMIGGTGSLRGVLEGTVAAHGLQEDVHFLGRVPEDQLAATYAAADCFVLPTRALECFGLIVLEAWASGTPVIASNVAAIPELVRQQGGEWLFEVDRAEELADRMTRFIHGQLPVPRDVRCLSERYHREHVLKHWTELATGSDCCA